MTATTLLGFGDLLVDRGRPEEAEPLLREALASRQASLQAGNWQIAEARSALGGSLSALGQPEADPLLQGALVTLRRREGDADPITARAIQRLAAHRARSGQTIYRRAERP